MSVSMGCNHAGNSAAAHVPVTTSFLPGQHCAGRTASCADRLARPDSTVDAQHDTLTVLPEDACFDQKDNKQNPVQDKPPFSCPGCRRYWPVRRCCRRLRGCCARTGRAAWTWRRRLLAASTPAAVSRTCTGNCWTTRFVASRMVCEVRYVVTALGCEVLVLF